MRFEMLQCDVCTAQTLYDDVAAFLWTIAPTGEDLCPRCTDARAAEAECDLSIGGPEEAT
jgi:hypothetical protein